MLGEIGPQRRVNSDALRNFGVHFLLNQSGMKMAGVQRNQSEFRHETLDYLRVEPVETQFPAIEIVTPAGLTKLPTCKLTGTPTPV